MFHVKHFPKRQMRRKANYIGSINEQQKPAAARDIQHQCGIRIAEI